MNAFQLLCNDKPLEADTYLQKRGAFYDLLNAGMITSAQREAFDGIDGSLPFPCSFETMDYSFSEGAFVFHFHAAAKRYRAALVAISPEESVSIHRFTLEAPPSFLWHQREARRFVTGDYISHAESLPWHDDSRLLTDETSKHFCHVSKNNPEQVAFTPDDSAGFADRQTRMAPGRYLKRFFSHILSAEEIEAYAREFAKWNSTSEVNYLADADDIEDAYANGPSSCMAGRASEFEGHCHPVRVYASPDIRLAVIYGRNDSCVKARGVVNFKDKLYGRLYGDSWRLEAALKRDGFAQSDSALVGCRILRIVDKHNSDNFIMPYIDNASGAAEHDSQFLILTKRSSDYSVDSTSGVCEGEESERWHCDSCGSRMGEEDVYSCEDRILCEGCYDSETIFCEYSEETRFSDGAREVQISENESQTWCADAVRNYAIECAQTGELWHEDSLIQLADDSLVSPTWARAHAYQCRDDLQWYRLGDGPNGIQGPIAGRDESPDQCELWLIAPSHDSHILAFRKQKEENLAAWHC